MQKVYSVSAVEARRCSGRTDLIRLTTLRSVPVGETGESRAKDTN